MITCYSLYLFAIVYLITLFPLNKCYFVVFRWQLQNHKLIFCCGPLRYECVYICFSTLSCEVTWFATCRLFTFLMFTMFVGFFLPKFLSKFKKCTNDLSFIKCMGIPPIPEILVSAFYIFYNLRYDYHMFPRNDLCK